MSSENMLLWKTVLIVLGFKSHTSYIYFLINVLTSSWRLYCSRNRTL